MIFFLLILLLLLISWPPSWTECQNDGLLGMAKEKRSCYSALIRASFSPMPKRGSLELLACVIGSTFGSALFIFFGGNFGAIETLKWSLKKLEEGVQWWTWQFRNEMALKNTLFMHSDDDDLKSVSFSLLLELRLLTNFFWDGWGVKIDCVQLDKKEQKKKDKTLFFIWTDIILACLYCPQ